MTFISFGFHFYSIPTCLRKKTMLLLLLIRNSSGLQRAKALGLNWLPAHSSVKIDGVCSENCRWNKLLAATCPVTRFRSKWQSCIASTCQLRNEEEPVRLACYRPIPFIAYLHLHIGREWVHSSVCWVSSVHVWRFPSAILKLLYGLYSGTVFLYWNWSNARTNGEQFAASVWAPQPPITQYRSVCFTLI